VRARVIKDGQEMAQAAAGIAPDVGLARPNVQRTADLLGSGDLTEHAANPAYRRARASQHRNIPIPGRTPDSAAGKTSPTSYPMR
jgi:hypothetical protein